MADVIEDVLHTKVSVIGAMRAPGKLGAFIELGEPVLDGCPFWLGVQRKLFKKGGSLSEWL